MYSKLKQPGFESGYFLSILSAVFFLSACSTIDTDAHAEISCDWVLNTVHTINPYEFSPPVSIITNIINDSKGRLYFSQYRDPVIGLLDSTGVFMQWIGKAGNGPGEFLSSHIIIGSMDSLIVQDFFLRRINIYSPEDFTKPGRIINHDKFYNEMIITAEIDGFVYQTAPRHHLHMSQDSVFILKMNKSETTGDTILAVKGPDFIVERGDRSINVVHLADRRNIYFTYQPESFTLFENDLNVISEYDYEGNVINQFEVTFPPVVDYSNLIEQQFSLMGGISGDQLAEQFKTLSARHNSPYNRALFHEAIKLDDSYYFKLIVNSSQSKWLSYNKISGIDNTIIYCHENPTLSIKGHNGYYYYGTGITGDFEQSLYLMEPVQVKLEESVPIYNPK
ncbi:MAG: 6-bladed beta-propeller [Balneolaceae bacterium]|nr:MAG: 6-bladed beta-propeller [Balneolaceae bacterium]